MHFRIPLQVPSGPISIKAHAESMVKAPIYAQHFQPLEIGRSDRAANQMERSKYIVRTDRLLTGPLSIHWAGGQSLVLLRSQGYVKHYRGVTNMPESRWCDALLQNTSQNEASKPISAYSVVKLDQTVFHVAHHRDGKKSDEEGLIWIDDGQNCAAAE